jgi:hypothetical protein
MKTPPCLPAVERFFSFLPSFDTNHILWCRAISPQRRGLRSMELPQGATAPYSDGDVYSIIQGKK